jgi:hypothetical protein
MDASGSRYRAAARLLVMVALTGACSDGGGDHVEMTGQGGAAGQGGGGVGGGAGGGNGGGGNGGAGATVSQMVGPDGGVISTPEGVVLVIPAGALGADTEVSITPIVGGLAGAVSDAFEIGPDGTQFAIPAELTLAFDASRLGHAA